VQDETREIDLNPLLKQALEYHLVFGHRGALLGCLDLAINSLLETHDGHPSPPSLPCHV
jgi:hypothetical protein